jgi:hypothetical protein
VNCQFIPAPVAEQEAQVSAALPADLWHRRFGHTGLQTVKKAEKAVEGIGEVLWPKEESTCQVRPLAKQTAAVYPRSGSKAEVVLELVHSDVMGPFPVEDLEERDTL